MDELLKTVYVHEPSFHIFIFLNKRKLKETTAVNLADNKTKLYFDMLSELDNRINDFNISDIFLQIVRKYISN